jgi:hypothetical protein
VSPSSGDFVPFVHREAFMNGLDDTLGLRSSRPEGFHKWKPIKQLDYLIQSDFL